MDEKKSPYGTLVEPLTWREQAILLHLAEDKSYREIATLEVLALNTVKWYIQQLYAKLGVNNRRQALERARSLGLLATPVSISPPKKTAAEIHPSKFPTGTVTFLFTDMEGSVPIWERDPVAMKTALGRHHDILYAAAQHHNGLVFKILGDEFQIAFEVPEDALEAALEAQRALRDEPWGMTGPLMVRMGLHTGPAEVIEGVLDTCDYAVSHTINRVARIRSAAHGGQVLLSAATCELLHGYQPQKIYLRDKGEVYLKGMSLPEHVFQLVVPDLPDVFPPLLSISHPNHNLPLQLTSFIGRETEISTVLRLLANHRLVTLTGSGGTGKSRLTLQVAAEVLKDYPNGAWLAELVPLADPALVPKTVATALGVPETPGRDIQESLVNFLRPKHLLLILDNCEHLLQACASLTDALLHACPHLTILASSREILGVEGETPFRVPPMTLPDLHQLPPLTELPRYDAVRLFVERGQVVLPGFDLTANNAHTISQVVSRLDGIPLAIELAAARLRLLSLEQIESRLNDTFRLLTGGSRTVLPRHQTLRALIDWSYNLLSKAERTMLHRLSVFAGSWNLEAAEQVCADENKAPGAILPADILDLLGGLVDKSLIFTSNEVGGINRFGMLETIRQYAHEKLVDAKEAEMVRSRHMQYFCQMGKVFGPKIRSREQIETLDRLELELGNLRLALEWALQTDIEAELILATALKWLWHIRTHWEEGIQWLERGLEAEQVNRDIVPPGPHRTVLRAEALSVLGFHLFIKGFGLADNSINERSVTCLEESITLFRTCGCEISSGYAYAVMFSGGKYKSPEQSKIQAQEALDIFRRVGDPHDIAEALQGLASCEMAPASKRRLYQEQLALDQANGDTEGIATALWNIGQVDWQDAEWEHALQTFEASLDHYRQVRNSDLIATLLILLGGCSIFTGDLRRADQYIMNALAACSELGDDYMVPQCWLLRSQLNISAGRFPQAVEALEQAWRISQKKDNQGNVAWLLATRARVARLQGEPDQARQLAQEGLKASHEMQNTDVDLLLELGQQALECDDLPGATSYWREGVQHLIRARATAQWENYLDGLALLAARQGKVELAARLFGTRWCRGYFHILSPSERAVRTAIQAEVQSLLGEGCYTQLSQEGQRMTFMQMLATVKEFLELS